MGYCPNCGALTSDFAFCPRCGVKLDDFQASDLKSTKEERLACCPQCGESAFASDFCPKRCAHTSGANACPNCGARIESDAQTSEPPVIPSFSEAVKICVFKTFNPNGRASRTEFWSYILFLLLTITAAASCATTFFYRTPTVAIVIFLSVLSFLILPFCATVRRFHDVGKSGVNCLLFPLGFFIFCVMDSASLSSAPVGWIGLFCWLFLWDYALVLLVWKPTPGANAYGPEPRKRP